MEKVQGIIKNPYFKVAALYFAAHFFMLLLSGCWWDDWTFMTHDLNYINIVASESGRPEWNFLVPLCWSLPNNGRILIFFLYLGISLFVFDALKNSTLYDENESLIIALLFAAFPVNEARILISNFAYTVGLFFFYLSFMLFMRWNKLEAGKKKNKFRVLLLCLFFLGFLLNSVLAYYYILIAYLFVLELKRSEEKNIIKRVLFAVKDVLMHYPDFFVLPFVYYGFNKIFFPTHGETFGSYNSVTLSGLFKCFLYVPVSVVKVFVDVARKAISCINIYTVAILVLAVAVNTIRQKKETNHDIRWIDSLLNFIYGVFVMAMAAFPYVMVRGRALDTIGVKGRDSVLVPLGAAIILYSLLSVINGKIRKIVLSVLLILEVICFNSLYIEWQKDYYYQLSMQNLMNNEIIKLNDTFFVTDLNETEVQGQRYYSFNALSYFLFGDETRFFVPKVSELYILENEKHMKEAIEVLGYSHMMQDYKPDDYNFDAILDYQNDLSWKDVVRLKMDEMFAPDKFNEFIKSSGKLDIYVVEDDFTKALLKGYDEGKIRHDDDVLELLAEYGY